MRGVMERGTGIGRERGGSLRWRNHLRRKGVDL